MRIRNSIAFIFQVTSVALAALVVVLFLKPELLQHSPSVVSIKQRPERLPQENETGATGSFSGPVSYAAAVESAAPAVVNIFSARIVKQRANPLLEDPLFRRFFGSEIQSLPRERLETSLGSGVIMDASGFIMTNNHVIEQADKIHVQIHDGRHTEARVIGIDPETDLAILKIELPDLPSITLAAENDLRVGDVVLAIGNPYGVGKTVTLGIVSATGRSQLGINTFENFIQTDAAINPGNSGGALVNAHGDMVGINTAIFSKSGGSQGIGFAIPSRLASQVMQQIIEHGHVIRGWLGVEARELTSDIAQSLQLDKKTHGVLVVGILRHGPANVAGILPGDVITHINNEPATTSRELLNNIANTAPGTRVNLKILRSGKTEEIQAQVGERPPMVRNPES